MSLYIHECTACAGMLIINAKTSSCVGGVDAVLTTPPAPRPRTPSPSRMNVFLIRVVPFVHQRDRFVSPVRSFGLSAHCVLGGAGW